MAHQYISACNFQEDNCAKLMNIQDGTKLNICKATIKFAEIY